MDKKHHTRKMNVREFFKRFPDDAACLEHIMSVRYGHRHTCGKCGVVDATFHRLENRKAYACSHCGDNLYPCAGTIFEKSRTPLTVWFYAIFLFVSTRHGVSGMELHRQLGVTRKTGYRMGMQIRQLMTKADYQGLLGGMDEAQVEIDEAYVGGRRKGKAGRGAEGKTVVMGMWERNGFLRCKVVPNASQLSLRTEFKANIAPGTVISTDEWRGYSLVIGDGHAHGTVCHGRGEYVNFDDAGYRHDTNSLESFWRLFKASVRGTHVQISKGKAEAYLNEFTFRQNHREMGQSMFDVLLAAA
ncbi:MAG: family transposase [Alphaproteobacteria bacterium]|nr:family transposase [Alphaproteobacteria bacterium]